MVTKKSSPPIPFEEYRKLDAVNFSTLKHVRRSLLHYRNAVDTPDKDTTGRLKGRAMHTAILEPHLFDELYPVFPGKTRRGVEWDEFKAANPGKAILKQDERDLVMRQRDAVLKHERAAEYLSKGVAELTLVWTDPTTKLKCKGRIDWLSHALPALVDLKGFPTLDRHRVERTAAEQGYHLQAAWYLSGHSALTSDTPRNSVMIACETDKPFDVAVFEWDLDALAVAEQENIVLLQKVAEARRSGHYPGQYPEQSTLTLPAWMFAESENDLSELDFGDDEQMAGVG